ncbi:amidase [Xylophilus sp. GOD-11R]|uniref:amidase n=1 Tax=Xylophilus sp. GOD-11R TaxID=3089814 RepID=UPI00298BD947|nr:amidase [Xylophilus sp. GOD-11R]WPB56121.1 amidase [Xylophilus sp. GOD-11R]
MNDVATEDFSDLAELGRQLRDGRSSSVFLVKTCLDRIARLNGELHAFSSVFREEALQAAEAADRQLAAGFDLGPLHGIPVALKDNVDLMGRATTAGSPLLADNIATGNAWITQRLLAEGAVIVGKTHMVQFALGAWGTNDQMGTPRNPWGRDVHRSPGGSSSGSAVAVAAGMVPLSIGTDTGGSVRMPASFCGITGLKPTVGKLKTDGVVPLSTTLDSVGLFTLTAADAALAYAALVGETPRPASLAGQRIGYLGDADLEGVQPEVLAAYRAALEVFRAGGAHLSPIALTGSFDNFAAIAAAIMLPEGASFWGALAADEAKPMDSAVRPRLVAGGTFTATAYYQALRQRDALKGEIAEVLRGYDAFVTPATPHTATPIAEVDHGKPPVKYTRAVNLLDLCGVSVQLGFDDRQLPIGLQIAAAQDEDAKLMEIACAFQAATSWHRSRWRP